MNVVWLVLLLWICPIFAGRCYNNCGQGMFCSNLDTCTLCADGTYQSDTYHKHHECITYNTNKFTCMTYYGNSMGPNGCLSLKCLSGLGPWPLCLSQCKNYRYRTKGSLSDTLCQSYDPLAYFCFDRDSNGYCERIKPCSKCTIGTFITSECNNNADGTDSDRICTALGGSFTCPKNTFLVVDANEQNKCVPCDNDGICDGTVSSGCKAGSFKKNNSCVQCNAGEYSGAGAYVCTKCDAGTFSNTTGTEKSTTTIYDLYTGTSIVQCTQCSKGTYSFTGAVWCTNCPRGTYSDTTKDMCVECAVGMISNESSSKCVVNNVLTYVDSTPVYSTPTPAYSTPVPNSSQSIIVDFSIILSFLVVISSLGFVL
jgi:hypothetical protein